MKKALNIIRTVLTWILLVFTVCMVLFTVISVTTFDKNNRSVFGYKAFIVLSDSMSATDFNAGDVAVVRTVEPSVLKEGDIITFVSTNEASYGEIITHKIRRLAQDVNGEPCFVTYGTTTDTNDQKMVDYSHVVGKYKFRLPKVGYFFNYLKTVPGYICFILIPFAIFIFIQSFNTVSAFRKYKAEQNEALQSEKDELAAEKKRTEEMQAEIEALKAKLEKTGNKTEDGSGKDNE